MVFRVSEGFRTFGLNLPNDKQSESELGTQIIKSESRVRRGTLFDIDWTYL